MLTEWEIAVTCSECSQEFFESCEGENGRCMDCCACLSCGRRADQYTLAIDGHFCGLRCEEMFILADGVGARTRKSIAPSVRRAVFERDEWVCHLCSSAIPPEEQWPSPRSATLDHVIPWSKGGADDAENLRAAHAGCNLSRKDRDLILYLASL